MELNRIYNEDNLVTCKRMPDGFIDLVMTSPPYDNLRDYNGLAQGAFEALAVELYRIIKTGGVVVWVVGDETVDGSETGTSFRQALFFQSLGFRIHDTMLYRKNSPAFPAKPDGVRYSQVFEYMFVFSKDRPTAHLLCDKRNKYAGATSFDGKIPPVPEYSPRENIWEYTTSFNEPTGHPAVFPEQLAKDHILSWSNPNDIIYDPFMGSGTTAKAAHQLGRRWVGSEISAEYVEAANKRLEPYLAQHGLFGL